eukprot:TRINITY_DN5153_c0_g1_i2.p1 TRINITY_DN5153_c0_g1~~TRINITY_DN5153_c0_g1_i2.p1  ORF type:complete len:157 (+),score=27.39 TRINITY_DN5153_c0_g1_i2:355-825(+)
MEASMSSIVDLLHTKLVDRHKEWNDTYSGGRILEQFDENCNIQYWSYVFSSRVIKARDFVVCHRMTTRDGATVLIETTAQHKDVPKTKKFIRCEIPYNVRWVKPTEDGKKLHYLYMNLTDIGGMIPIWLANVLNPDVSAKEVQLIKQICEKEAHGK